MECHHETHARAAANRSKQSSSPNTRPATSCGSSGGEAHAVVVCVSLCGMVDEGSGSAPHVVTPPLSVRTAAPHHTTTVLEESRLHQRRARGEPSSGVCERGCMEGDDGIPRALASSGRGLARQCLLHTCIVVVRTRGRASRGLCWGLAARKDTAIAIMTVLTAATAVHEAHQRTLQPVVPDLAPVARASCIVSASSRALTHRVSSHTHTRWSVYSDA